MCRKICTVCRKWCTVCSNWWSHHNLWCAITWHGSSCRQHKKLKTSFHTEGAQNIIMNTECIGYFNIIPSMRVNTWNSLEHWKQKNWDWKQHLLRDAWYLHWIVVGKLSQGKLCHNFLFKSNQILPWCTLSAESPSLWAKFRVVFIKISCDHHLSDNGGKGYYCFMRGAGGDAGVSYRGCALSTSL